MISSLAKAIPTRKPASPHALERVCNHHQVSTFGEFLDKCFLPAKVDICLINHYNAVKIGQQGFNIIAVDRVARRVIWRADENEFGIFIDSFGNAL
jgi:hypothetical protein